MPEDTWHCSIPDVTVPMRPDLRWMEDDLEKAMSHLFDKTPDIPEAGETAEEQPKQPEMDVGDKKPIEYRGVYYIPAGHSITQFSDRGSNGRKLSKFVVGKHFTDYGVSPAGLPTPTV